MRGPLWERLLLFEPECAIIKIGYSEMSGKTHNSSSEIIKKEEG